jgi:hypothetical protein
MFANFIKNINVFFDNIFRFLPFRKKHDETLIDDIETCNFIKDDTTTFTE